jgi:hypothetical protein
MEGFTVVRQQDVNLAVSQGVPDSVQAVDSIDSCALQVRQLVQRSLAIDLEGVRCVLVDIVRANDA